MTGWWRFKLLTAAAIGLPLHYAGRTRLGAPIARWLLPIARRLMALLDRIG